MLQLSFSMRLVLSLYPEEGLFWLAVFVSAGPASFFLLSPDWPHLFRLLP